MTSEEWKALQGLAGDRSFVIRQADNGSCVLGKEDYLKEAEKQFQYKSVHKDLNLKETILLDLVEKVTNF